MESPNLDEGSVDKAYTPELSVLAQVVQQQNANESRRVSPKGTTRDEDRIVAQYSLPSSIGSHQSQQYYHA